MLLQLSLETRDLHSAADEGWLRLLGEQGDRATYIDQLERVYGFEAPLEAAFAYTPQLKDFLDLRTRSRAGLCAQDLLSLGLSAADVTALPHCVPIAPFATPHEAFGWMYVVERLRLVHASVRRHVLTHIPDAWTACSYLSASTTTTVAQWYELGCVLDQVAEDDRTIAALIAAARVGFGSLIQWSRGANAAHARSA